MALAAKIFIIIGTIAGAPAILPLIFGIIALNKMKKGEMTTGWAIVVLLFVNMIGGILLLCDPNKGNA
jgi:hypothetical protein